MMPHKSALLEAYRYGYLNRATSPIHRYLLTAGALRSDAREQYIKDLQERWLLFQEPLERHQKWKAFHGRLAELQFAGWLEEEKSYEITGLEALRKGPDIEAVLQGRRSTFEVKFIGSENADFRMLVKSLEGTPNWDWVSVSAPGNYLVFRVYEAAKQLEHAEGKRTAVLIIDDLAWRRLACPLKHGEIEWSNAGFVPSDGRWNEFVTLQYKKYPGLPDDIAETIRSVHSIWILRQSSELEFCLKHEIPISAGEP
jgi:hypothetical protein